MTEEIFGRVFAKLDWDHQRQLMTLEREGCIYSDHYIDELNDFRHVKISFSLNEAREYARRMWAYDLFLQSKANWAKEVPGIDEDIAEEADEYAFRSKDGIEIRPWHCPAAFMGRHLESLVCSNARIEILEEQGRSALLSTIRRTIYSLPVASRLLSNREAGLACLRMTCEDDVRDLIYVMLLPAITDLKREEPIPSIAGKHSIVDLYSEISRLLLEIKWIGKKGRWKRIVDEIKIDIQSYAIHHSCQHMIFLIVDAVKDIPNPGTLEKELSGEQEIRGRRFGVTVYVKEL